MPQAFDCNDVLIKVPVAALGPDRHASIKVTFKSALLQVVTLTDETDPDELPDSYTPIGAISIVDEPCSLRCDNTKVHIGTALSRVSCWIGKLVAPGPIASQELHFQVRAAVGPNSEVQVARRWDSGVAGYGVQGEIFAVGCCICEQIELWGRVPSDGLGEALPQEVTCSMIVDHLPTGGILLPNGVFLKRGQFTL